MANHLTNVTLLHEQYPTADHYPFNLPIFRHTRRLDFDTPVTLFVGENGAGKSTLLEALAISSGVHIWRKSDGSRCRFNPYEKLFHRYLSLEWSDGRVPGAYFGSESFNDFAHSLEGWAASDPGQLDYFGGKSLLTQSHGQSVMSYFRSRYQIRGLYFLDEPETALSPRSQLALLDVIAQNVQAGHAQFIIATHSPILLSCEHARIYSFDHDSAQVIDYEQTDHFQIYRDFLLNRAQ